MKVLLALLLMSVSSYAAQPKIGSITVVAADNGTTTNLTETSRLTVGASGTQGAMVMGDADGSNTARITPAAVTTGDINIILPAAPGNGVLTGTASGTNVTLTFGSSGSAVYVAGASVSNPNFISGQFAVNASTNVAIANAASLTNPVISGIVTLTDAATVATDASTGSTYKVTLGGNRTLGNPTNAKDGQTLKWEVIQDGTGSHTLAMDTKFAFGTDITGITLTTTASKRDFITAIYDATADKFYVVGFVRGY